MTVPALTSKDLANAVEEVAKTLGLAVEAGRDVGRYGAEVLGPLPHNLVGLTLGDRIQTKRWENLLRLLHKAKERLAADGIIESEPVSLTVAVPLLEAATYEDRDELVDLWARLLAAAMDPARAGDIKQDFIETVRKLDPVDARVFRTMRHGITASTRDYIAGVLGVGPDRVEVSLIKLHGLGCVSRHDGNVNFDPLVLVNGDLSAYGRELRRALGIPA